MNGESSSNLNPSEIQGVCPNGWHIPSDNEWKELEIYLGTDINGLHETGWRITNEGGKLKESGFEYWISPNTGATNESKFNARPGGYRDTEGVFRKKGYQAIWWCTREFGWGSSFFRRLDNDRPNTSYAYTSMSEGCSVRCIKDK